MAVHDSRLGENIYEVKFWLKTLFWKEANK